MNGEKIAVPTPASRQPEDHEARRDDRVVWVGRRDATDLRVRGRSLAEQRLGQPPPSHCSRRRSFAMTRRSRPRPASTTRRFEYGALDELLGTYVRLEAAGVLPHSVLDHGMTLSSTTWTPTATASSCRSTTSATGPARRRSCTANVFGRGPDRDGTSIPHSSSQPGKQERRRPSCIAVPTTASSPPPSPQDLRVPFGLEERRNMNVTETDVLIVGAGPAGCQRHCS